tara:strand:- start:1245 stop:2348 length:1104 start_codon:yes stop_codon:yes gene_type:complete
MEFTSVRVLDDSNAKGVAEKEAELLANHEAAQIATDEARQSVEETPKATQVDEVVESNDLKEEDVLSYIGKRYNKQINSFDELMAERSQAEEMPEDVAAYMKYKKDTGRGFDDFLKLRKDFESMDQDQLLKEYISLTQQGLDPEDVDVMMEDYRYDEDLDDESTVKRVKLAKKKAIVEAKRFFTQQKEQYKMPLESSAPSVPDEEKEIYESYKQYTKQAKTLQEENERKAKWFDSKTNELFNGEFKGFEFKIDDKTVKFTPGDASELKKAQSSPMNFIGKFLDESGMIKDAVGYHRALAVAMNPEKFAKFFYEQGMANATDDVMRKTKNINMSERRAPEVTSAGGFQVKAVNPDSGRKLKISSAKRI